MKNTTTILCFVLMIATIHQVGALPAGESVSHGQVSFERNGTDLLIQQDSSRAIVNYRSFDVASGETVRFNQPGASASILNRISGGASTIAGSIQANGNVFFINRSGILFSSAARVDVHGLVASSMDLSDRDFLSGNLDFSGSGGSVINRGHLSGDFVYLVGGSVQNSGRISAKRVALAAGTSSVKIDEAAGGEITLIIDGESFTAGADGEPETARDEPGGEPITPDAEVDGDTGSETVAQETDAEEPAEPATSAANDEPQEVVLENGDVLNDGAIDASGENGGQVAVAANRIAHTGSIHADGSAEGGGAIDLLSRETLVLSDTAVLSANAGETGRGGDIILFTEGNAYFPQGATVEARGGSQSGTGGFVEFSGVEHLELSTIPDVSATDNEQHGSIYIDPTDVDIGFFTAESGGNFNPTAPFTYTPSSGLSEIANTTVQALLNAGDVTISTTSGFNGANGGRLRVLAPINFNNNVARTLSLQADNNIRIDADIGPSTVGVGPLNLDLRANNGIVVIGNIGLEGGSFDASADEDGGGGNFGTLSQINTFGGDINIKGDNFNSLNVALFGNDVALEFTGNIEIQGAAAAQSTLRLEADGNVILNGGGAQTGLFSVDGTAICADHDLNGDGDVITQGGTFAIHTDGGPIFMFGQNLELTSADVKTPSFAPNVLSLVAIQNIDLRNPDTDALHFGSDVYVQAGNTVELSTQVKAVNQALVSAQQINATPHASGANVQGDTVGLQALNHIGNPVSPVIIDAPNTLVQAGVGAPVHINNVNPNPTVVDFAASGDLSTLVPIQLQPKPTANIIIDNRMGGNMGGGNTVGVPPDAHGGNNTPAPPDTSSSPMDLVLTSDPGIPQRMLRFVGTSETMQTGRRAAPAVAPSLLQEMVSIPVFGTLQRQRIERARAVPIIETPSGKVTAVQFSEYYFMHEKMQISEYANDLDLYFIDYLVFGVAEITADPRIPIEVKGTVINGGPRPYQL